MLGLAHTLIATERADLEFFARYCTGYEAWRAYLLGRNRRYRQGRRVGGANL
jgi:anaerobic selenocysteine-containing dehydrogenase